MADGPEDDWEDDEDDGPADGDGADGPNEDGQSGRVRSDFHSGGGPEARYRPY